MKVLVTGGAGFIGSAVVRQLLELTDFDVVNLDALTYAANLGSLAGWSDSPRYQFVKADLRVPSQLAEVFETRRPDAVIHLAAETHVDRSIAGSGVFVESNIVGTYNLLEACKAHWMRLGDDAKGEFRLIHVSTDEVFGDLDDGNGSFSEASPYAPSSPYSASKAAADHLVRAWGRTYGLPVLITNCSNNYGPFQFADKLIPLTISNSIVGKEIPVYGNGRQIRDWLFVDDHARALISVLTKGRTGETFAIGGRSPRTNLDVISEIHQSLEKLLPARRLGIQNYNQLISFVTDRPGHDRAYRIDPSKIENELGWRALESFESGIEKTVYWFVNSLDLGGAGFP